MPGNASTRTALAVASGLMLALSFPKFDLGFAAWIAFVPLLHAIEGQSTRRVFTYAWIQGFACYVASIYWVVITLHNFAGVPLALAVLPMLLLAAVMALYTGAAFYTAEFITRRLDLPILFTLPLAWAAVEWIRTYFPIGFPWNLLGYAAYQNLNLIQFAEFTGVYGISALIVLFNTVIYVVLFRRESTRIQLMGLGVLSGLLVVAWVFGTIRVKSLEQAAPAGSLKIAMVQGDIPQSIKWDPNFLSSSFDIYAEQSERAAQMGADLIVWPEAAAAFFFQPEDRYPAVFAKDETYRAKLLTMAAQTHDAFLFGAPALGVEDDHVGFYNRAYLVTGDGRVAAWYDKINLVPFGEYVPLRGLLGGLVNRVVKGFGDMFPGRVQTIFDFKGARLGILICYESVFPDLARRAVKSGADILVNITNDAWYGDSSAPYQLLAMAAMRSVETKAPMVRVANTGISAVIQPTGEIDDRTPLFKRGTEIETVPFRPVSTVYVLVGDVFAISCLILVLIGLLAAFFYPRPRQTAPEEAEPLFHTNGTAAR
ncbi:MAG TPA: apolipoprotein N-acyltransferase [Candidatus Binataceae bacterium]|nr:apolipoprotein N-acyltransferase [Candidatus Binataceae bacterium]